MIKMLDSRKMRFGKIDDMDVIADARTVRRVVVVAEYAQAVSLANGDLTNKWHEVVWDAVGVFAYPTAWVRADGIEVAQ